MNKLKSRLNLDDFDFIPSEYPDCDVNNPCPNCKDLDLTFLHLPGNETWLSIHKSIHSGTYRRKK